MEVVQDDVRLPAHATPSYTRDLRNVESNTLNFQKTPWGSLYSRTTDPCIVGLIEGTDVVFKNLPSRLQ